MSRATLKGQDTRWSGLWGASEDHFVTISVSECSTCGKRKRWHTEKPHSSRFTARVLDKRLHQTAGTVYVHLGLRRLWFFHQLVVDGEASQCDDGVSTHGAVAFVVHEQHPQIGLRQLAVHDQGPVHVIVSPRLVHERPPEVVQMFPDVTALGKHAVTFDLRVATEDDPQRLSARVHVDHRELVSLMRWKPSLHLCADVKYRLKNIKKTCALSPNTDLYWHNMSITMCKICLLRGFQIKEHASSWQVIRYTRC